MEASFLRASSCSKWVPIPLCLDGASLLRVWSGCLQHALTRCDLHLAQFRFMTLLPRLDCLARFVYLLNATSNLGNTTSAFQARTWLSNATKHGTQLHWELRHLSTHQSY